MATMLLEVHKLSKRAGERWLLADVDLSLQRGSTMAFMGPNGAGKSTLLRVLAGLTRIDQGSVQWRGSSEGDKLDASLYVRRQIGYLGHEPGLFEALSGRENLRFFAGVSGLERAAEQTETALQDVGLEFWADDPVYQYSRGMRQRLGLARALLHRPSALLLDEPFTGLDPGSRSWLLARLSSFRQGGGSTILVSHRYDEVISVADEYLILSHGRVAAQGSLAEMTTEAMDSIYADAVTERQPNRSRGRYE